MKENNQPRKVALYLRVSTDDQVEKYGESTQREAIMNLIKSRAHLDKPFIFAGDEYVYFDDGVSGTTPVDERPAFARLKESIIFSSKENRPFDIVAVYRIDRFARKLRVLQEITDFFEVEGIEFVSVTENIDTSSPFGKAILSIIGVIAELEVETIKQRTQAGKLQAAKVGVYMGSAPVYGYTKTPDKKLKRIEVEAKYVKTIFDLYVNQRLGIGEIAKYLKDHNVPSPQVSAIKNSKRVGKIKKQNSNFHWSDQSVRRILKNELYTGIYHYGKMKNGNKVPQEQWKISEVSMPVIIDSLMFQRAQEILERSKHEKAITLTRPESYLLSGLLSCDNCSHSKKRGNGRNKWAGTPKLVRSTGEYRFYYSCTGKNYSKYEKRCGTLPLPAKEIEKYIIKLCLNLINQPLAVYKHQQELISSKIETKQLDKQIEELNKLILGLPKRKELLLEQHEHGYIKTKELKNKIKDIEHSELTYIKELRIIQEKLAQNSISEGYLKTLELFNVKYQSMLSDIEKNHDEIYKLLHTLIDEIIVYSRDIKKTDRIAGRKKEGQKVPYRLSIRLKLPQDILRELDLRMAIEKTSDLTDVSSSQNDISRGR